MLYFNKEKNPKACESSNRSIVCLFSKMSIILTGKIHILCLCRMTYLHSYPLPLHSLQLKQ